MKASVGRIVHYVSRGSADGVYKPECRAAIITATDQNPDDVPEPGQVFAALAVLNPEGMFFNGCVIQNEDTDHVPGTWHWPERVEA